MEYPIGCFPGTSPSAWREVANPDSYAEAFVCQGIIYPAEPAINNAKHPFSFEKPDRIDQFDRWLLVSIFTTQLRLVISNYWFPFDKAYHPLGREVHTGHKGPHAALWPSLVVDSLGCLVRRSQARTFRWLPFVHIVSFRWVCL
jgi:hypothetical protein